MNYENIQWHELSKTAQEIVLTAENHQFINRNILWLEKCVAKRFDKGKLVLVEHLANCYTLKRIISACNKIVKQYHEIKREDMKRARYFLAIEIIDNAK